jgi:hypothetical protein
MADPISFDPYLGWVDITDPDNIPQDARIIGASDLLRFEQLGKDVAEFSRRVGIDFAQSFPAVASYTYNTNGDVLTETIYGTTTTYDYNPDGSIHTATRDGVTRTFVYTDGNLTGVI